MAAPMKTDEEKCWSAVDALCSRYSKLNTAAAVPEARDWQVVRVFVSSTFSDFHSEREILVKKVFPELKEWCQQHKLCVIECDLRWGVPRDSTTADVISICLDELTRCKNESGDQPFFLTLLGGRYGWIPNLSDLSDEIIQNFNWIENLSITHMEIQYGAYVNRNPNSFFAIRNDSVADQVPDRFRSQFAAQTEFGQSMIKLLKKNIRSHFASDQVTDYTCSFDGVESSTGVEKVKLKDLEDFGVAVINFFKESITKRYLQTNSSESEQCTDIELEYHKNYRSLKSQFTLGRDEMVKTLLDFVTSEEIMWLNESDEPAKQQQALLVCGEPGMGKSSLLSLLTEELLKNDRSDVFYHYTGCSAKSLQYLNLLDRLSSFLSAHNDDASAKTSSAAIDKNNLISLMNAYTEKTGRNLVIILDALDQLSSRHRSDHLDWLPHDGLNPRVRIVASSSSTNLPTMARLDHGQVIRLQILDAATRRAIAQNFFKQYNKSLDADQAGILTSCEGAENPFWLRLACEEIRVFGVFETLTDKIRQLSSDITELINQIFARLIAEDDTGLIQKTLCLIHCSQLGLKETELQLLLGDSEPLAALTWAKIRRHLKTFLRRVSVPNVEEKLHFVHATIDRAIEASWECGEYHRLLADYYEHRCPDDGVVSDELPEQLMKSNQTARLLAFLRSDQRSTGINKILKSRYIQAFRCNRMVSRGEPNRFEDRVYICVFCENRMRVFGQDVTPAKTSCVLCGTHVSPHNPRPEQEAKLCHVHSRKPTGTQKFCVACGKFCHQKFTVGRVCNWCSGRPVCVHLETK